MDGKADIVGYGFLMRQLNISDSCTAFQGGLGNQLVISERLLFS